MSLQTEIIGLSLAYVMLAVLLLVAVVYARLPWLAKAAIIGTTSAFYVFAFFRIQGLLGWSSYESLPPRFELLWAHVVEGNVVDDEPGAIHLWVAKIDDKNLPSLVPRAYVLPYSAALAKSVSKARTEIALGHPQVGRPMDFGIGGGSSTAGSMTPARGGGRGGDPSGEGTLDLKYLAGGGPAIEFGPLPPPMLPPKELP